MNFTVIWAQQAEQELAALWLAAPDRNAVTQAAHEIDQRLASNAISEGESRVGQQRVLLVPPLGVLFEVEADLQLVWVLQVWWFDTHDSTT